MKTFVGVFSGLLIASAAAAQVAPADLTKTSADSVSSGVPQRDVFDLLKQLLNRDIEPEVAISPPIGLQWALLPTVSYNPVYGVAVGASLNGAGRRGALERALFVGCDLGKHTRRRGRFSFSCVATRSARVEAIS